MLLGGGEKIEMLNLGFGSQQIQRFASESFERAYQGIL